VDGAVALRRDVARWSVTSTCDQLAKVNSSNATGSRRVLGSAAKVLDDRMPYEHHPGATVLLEAAHRSQPGLQPTVICLDPVVGVSVGAVPCRWQ
jgi:hypothetical protein